MRHAKSRILKTSILAGALALGAGNSLADAAGPHGGGHHRCYSGCGCPVVEHAGTLTIDGRSFLIRTDRGMLGQIAAAFRKAGYCATVRDGCVHVDYGVCRPSVRWRADRYSTRLSWGNGTLGVSLRQRHVHPAPRYRPHRPIRRPVVRWGVRRGSCG